MRRNNEESKRFSESRNASFVSILLFIFAIVAFRQRRTTICVIDDLLLSVVSRQKRNKPFGAAAKKSNIRRRRLPYNYRPNCAIIAL